MILNAPFSVPESTMELEIITDSPGCINIEHIESIPPFEVKDSLVVARDNHIFKEFIYVKNNKKILILRLRKKFIQHCS